MQKQVLLSLLALAATVGSLYYFNTESNYTNEVYEIPQLTAYEEDIVFDNNSCTWNLNSKNIDNTMLVSISKTISRRLQSMAPEPIRIFEINLYNNKISNIEPLFEAIYEGLGYTLEQLYVNVGFNHVADVSYLSQWTVPSKLRAFDINLYSISTSKLKSIQGIISVFKRMQYAETFGVNIQNQQVSDIADLLDEIISTNKQINKLMLNFSSNPKPENWKDQLVSALGKQSYINSLNLGLDSSYITTTYLNQIESKVYNLKYLNEFIISVKSNNLAKNDVVNIFQDLSDKIGSNNVIIYV
ncbi:hypothetical protein PPERSA_02788 [Pseudocohnilembus persalinus]|uniref:Uncharacterized protein n=1 Tax=Pseudocohnilembus persalinus TaxID=266149 RepID=A0A0V0QMW1_PSEPJ|nr:hypothetical protein PPERSA_02788 [Pseudocohnilembus persalinus]|eukprot:KRX03409.1 hypothetical protein PPERSA_02788 [Pseudocohnilembus persalinus]